MAKYMHTLEGLPAQFYNGEGVCFNSKRVKLADSLRQIRREQAESKRIDEKRSSAPWRYGYVTVQA